MDQDLDFEIGANNHVRTGCGAILNGQMIYFGGPGPNNRRQVCIPRVYFLHQKKVTRIMPSRNFSLKFQIKFPLRY